MLEPMMASCRTLLGLGPETKSFVAREPSIGRVIPDLLVALWEGERTAQFEHRLTALDCHVLALIEERGVATATAVQDAFRLRSGRANETLGQLLRKGFLHSTNGAFELASGATTKNMQIVALEAKLARWRVALKQARSYLAFANSAWVVLDRNQCKITPMIQAEFQEDGIGLALLCGPVVQVVSTPRDHLPISGARWLAASKLRRAQRLQMEDQAGR